MYRKFNKLIENNDIISVHFIITNKWSRLKKAYESGYPMLNYEKITETMFIKLTSLIGLNTVILWSFGLNKTCE